MSGSNDHHDHSHDHDHDHDHAHGHRHPPPQPDDVSVPGRSELMILAMRELLVEKGVLTNDRIRRGFEILDSWEPSRGAEIVARAWTDPEFKQRLLTDGNAAVAEFGIDMGDAKLTVVENTESVQNVIVCTLCPPPEARESYVARQLHDPDRKGIHHSCDGDHRRSADGALPTVSSGRLTRRQTWLRRCWNSGSSFVATWSRGRGMPDESPFRHASADDSAGFLLWKVTTLWQQQLSSVLDGPDVFVDTGTRSATDALQIIYTSGTTGDPKGIVGDVQRLGRTGLLDRLYGYRPDDRPYTGLSFTHSNAQATALMPALHGGYRAVFSRRFTKSRLWDVCRRYGCTTFSVLGGMATALFAEPLRADDADNPVRLVISGGMPAAIWEAFEQRFGVGILEIYGASDGGGMAVKPPGVGPVGSIGRPIPGIVMKILDEEGNECPPGVVGEICCRPEAGEASVEYFGDASASHSKVREGWNRSGDMGHRDADGWLYFDYRRGGGIRRNGDFINPGFIERVIAEDPQIDDVFVYGVPARSRAPGDKDIVAAVVPVDPARFDVAAVFARCRALLEGNFVPGYLQVVAEIPKTASEKPREHLLLAAFDAGGPGLHRAS